MSDEELIFVDGSEQTDFSKGISFKEIVMSHLSKISNICTKEFKEGYWQKRPVNTGGGVSYVEIYHEDTREAYINSVDFLHDLLLPKFDKEMEMAMVEINQDIENNKINSKINIDLFKENRLLYRRKIFQQLSLLLKRKKYLETGAIID